MVDGKEEKRAGREKKTKVNNVMFSNKLFIQCIYDFCH